jgi:uncharacterized protein
MAKKTTLFVLFVCLVLGVAFLSHVFVYLSLLKFFGISSPRIKLNLLILLICLPLSFIFVSVFTHYWENLFIRSLYFFAGLWLGLVTTIVTAFLFVWAIFYIGNSTGWPVNLSWLGGLALIFSFVYSAYGVFNARKPRTKKITVKIKNLPVQWQNQKVVHISDIHLGHLFGKKFFGKIVWEINYWHPAAVFITGDLFDGMENSFEYVAPMINSIEAPKGIFFVTGNHENYLGLEKVNQILKETKIKTFHDDMVLVDGLQIIGINYPDRFVRKSVGKIIKAISSFDPEGPSILLYHSPFQVKQAKRAGIKLQLSGHTHRGQIFPYGIITKIISRNNHYGLHQKGDFSVYTSSGVGTSVPAMRTGTAPEIVIITLT